MMYTRYCTGIIDTLQEWNWKKRAERFLKTYFKCQSREGETSASGKGRRGCLTRCPTNASEPQPPTTGMSATDPSSYQERFERRVVKVRRVAQLASVVLPLV